MNGNKISLCLLALLLCAAGINATRGGAAGNAAGGSIDAGGMTEQKIQTAFLNSHAAITKAASVPMRGSTARAVTLSQMLANAAADNSVTHGAMQTMISAAGEAPRRSLLADTTSRFEDDRMKAAMYQVASTIDRAVSAGNVKGAKVAARAGRDMGQVATMPGTDFAIDHVPDMEMGARKLASRPDMETLWAAQNTAESIQMTGAGATKWGSINAGAASGFRGNSVLAEKMGDAIAHQQGNEMPRKLLRA